MFKRILFIFCLTLFTSHLWSQSEEFEKTYAAIFNIVWDNNDSAHIYLNQLQTLKNKINKPEFNAKFFNVEGVVYYTESNFVQAFASYQKAYDEAKIWGDHFYTGRILNNLAACYSISDDRSHAIEYFEMANSEFILAGDIEWQKNVQYNLACAYYMEEETAKADSLFLSLEQQYLSDSNYVFAGYCVIGHGDILKDAGNYEAALETYQKALRYHNYEDDPETASFLHVNLAQVYGELGSIDLALSEAHLSENFAAQIQLTKNRLIVAQTLSFIHKKNSQLDSALYYADLAYALNDSLKNETYLADFADNETQFNIKLKNETIALQDENLKINEDHIFLMRVVIIALILILFTIFYLVFRMYKQRKKLKRLIEDKEVLLREIHHRVKNNMQVVSSLLNMHVRKVEDEGSKKILEDGAERIQAMALIQKNLYPHSDLKHISLDDYLKNLSQQLFDNYNIHKEKITLKTYFDPIHVDIDKLIPIGLIVNEILCNSFKHAFKDVHQGEITLKLIDFDARIQLEIGDSGSMKSIPNLESANSLGMKFIRIFSHKLQADLNIIQHPTTSFILNFSKK